MRGLLGKSRYSLGEFYRIYYLAFLSASDFIKGKKRKLLSEHFIERIMLSVTEVNGCPICSYAHTKMALETGMSNKEIKNILEGVSEDIPENEMSGILFAQHYADTRGYPSKEAWEKIVLIYGLQEAKSILGTIRIIMFGNAAGIAWGSFVNRFKKGENPDKRSSVIYEIGMIFTTTFYLPLVILHFLIAKIFRVKVIKFRD